MLWICHLLLSLQVFFFFLILKSFVYKVNSISSLILKRKNSKEKTSRYFFKSQNSNKKKNCICLIWMVSNKWVFTKRIHYSNTFLQQHKKWLYTWTSQDGQYWNHWLYSLQLKMENLYTVRKKQGQELTVAHIMNFLLSNSDLNWRK